MKAGVKINHFHPKPKRKQLNINVIKIIFLHNSVFDTFGVEFLFVAIRQRVYDKSDCTKFQY
jgi:hypothetical protein